MSYYMLPDDCSDEQLSKEIEGGMRQLSNNSISLEQFTNGINYLKQRYSHKRILNLGVNILNKYNYLNSDLNKYNINKDSTYDIIIYNELRENSYIQQQEVMLKLQEFIDNKLKEQMGLDYQKFIQPKYQYFYPDNNKNIDTPPQIEDKSKDQTRDSYTDNARDTMRGIDYVRQARGPKAYTHMRRMLQRIWDIQHTHPSNRFDVDGTYSYDSHKLAEHIQDNASEAEINQAHTDVIATYKGRGRPKGARNKDKVVNKDFSELENVLDDVLGDSSDDVKQDQSSPQAQEEFKGDPSKFVTHPQLDKKAAELRNDISRVADAINSALRDEFNALEDKVNNIQLHQPTLVEIKVQDLPKVELGVQHHTFPILLKICSASLRNGNRIIPWVYGPAGTGKSTAAENVAKALSLPFYSLGKTLAKFEILGFINTSGYQSTEFRNAYENGGVFCADEMDAWSPEATVALNGALANGHCAFPDKSVRRHKDFIMITCANTVGTGATMDYVGRNKQDGATLDRFVNLFWCLDDALEDSMIANKDWLKYVRHVRARVQQSGINPKPIVSPRASLHGESLLFAGLDWETVVDLTLRKGLSDAQWNMIK